MNKPIKIKMAHHNKLYELEIKRAERKIKIVFSLIAAAVLAAVNYFLLW